MPQTDTIDLDRKVPPFDRFTTIQRLATARSGHSSVEHVRHQLYIGRDRRSATNMLVKITSRPGLVYQHNLANEIASLTTINRELPDSRYFPSLEDHGRLRDGRTYLITSLFDEFPLATAIGTERIPARMVTNLRTAIEVGAALNELHRLPVFHVDLNPMNILHRVERGRPVIRLVDFESSYEPGRHTAAAFYSPPTTPGYAAPELSRQRPDARADLFSLGAVLYTTVAGFGWTWDAEVGARIAADRELDGELKAILLRAVDTEPDRRYRSVEEFRGALADHLERIWPGRGWQEGAGPA